ncbi:tetratricopeptide repeat protein [Ruegeria sp. HKCCC2117]|uniref:tetratricopeptide repeat protein n=1 Tax=Ruegeria sp. HKCCC2117 TaxID=2682992 RepID=UPI001489354E|nr:tetratricopeptide repeat protein [Ruegeria sp. HKCCC2117]
MRVRLAALIVVFSTLLLAFNAPSKAERDYAKLRAACGMSGGSEMAIPACTALLDLNDEPLEARQDYNAKRAQALHCYGHYQRAIEDADRALSLNSEDAVTLIWRGYSKNALENKAGARADFEQAQKIRPNSTCVLFIVAKQMQAWGEDSLALEGYEKVLEIDPGYEDVGVRYLNLLYEAMPAEDFESQLTKAETKWPDQPWAHGVRVTYELRHGYDLGKALYAAESRIALTPNPKAENKIDWGEKGSVRRTMDLLLGYIVHGQSTEWVTRSHSFAALGATDLARAEYQQFLAKGGPYSLGLLMDIIEGADVPVDPQARQGAVEHINKAIDDHIRRLEQKVGFASLGPQAK